MERLFTFLFQSVLISGMLTAYYWVVLRNRKLHGYNRWFLLGTVGLSLLLPLVRIRWSPFAFAGEAALPVAAGRAQAAGNAAGGSFPWMAVAGWTGIGVSLVLLGMLLLRVVQVYRLKSRLSYSRMGGYDLIETDDPRAPFSFLNNLFWRRGADPEDPVNRRILYHELAHIGGRHSWDGLFVQSVSCVFWMNPFFWLIRRELSVVHEFIADAATGMEGDTEGFARMLLQSMDAGRFLEPAQGFFQSPIKRRLFMMSNNRRSRFCLLRKALVLPVVMVVTVFVSCTKERAPLVADRVDEIKLNKQKKDEKMMKFMIVGKGSYNVKLSRPLVFVRGSGTDEIKIKQATELMLQKLEMDEKLMKIRFDQK
ncbi:MAG TPA: M56 family metallopeptidase [Puia sp.]|nr:M56 family metallopeptidase [Puia sp.]